MHACPVCSQVIWKHAALLFSLAKCEKLSVLLFLLQPLLLMVCSPLIQIVCLQDRAWGLISVYLYFFLLVYFVVCVTLKI